MAIEVKTPQRKKQMTEDQKQFVKLVVESGNIGMVATCIEDVAKVIKYLNEDN